MRLVYIIAPALVSCLAGQPPNLGELERLGVIELKANLAHVQGIDLDDRHLWVTSVDSKTRKGFLHEFLLSTGELTRFVEVQDGVRFHPGGISADKRSIWIPVAEYRRESTTVIQQRDKKTLAVGFQFEVPDHIGCVAADPKVLVGGNWDSRELYVWDRRGRLLRKAPNSTGNAFQDIKLSGGMLIGGGLLPRRSGAIDWLDFPSLRPRRRMTVRNTDRGEPFTREGMAIRGGRLYLLPEDGPSRLYIYRFAQ
jgi:hypothetical protein